MGEVNGGDNLDRGLAYSVGTATAGAREQVLRTMPLLYSLTLRLRDAGVAPQWLASISMSRSLA